MILYHVTRAEKWEGHSDVAFCATLDRAKAEAQKEATKWNDGDLVWIEHTDQFPHWEAELDATSSYYIHLEQVLE